MSQEQHSSLPLTEDTNKRDYVYVRYEDDADDEMDIYDMISLCLKGLSILKRYIALLLVFLVVGCIAGFCKHKSVKEEYSSSALLFVDLNHDEVSIGDNVDESPRINMLANSLSQIMLSDAVIAPVAEQYADESETVADKMKSLQESLSVDAPGGSQTVRVTVTDKDSLVAQKICNDIVDAGISALNASTSYATISVIFPANEAHVVVNDDSAVSAIGQMAAIFLVLALMVIVIRELSIAYKAHNAAKEQ